ncbi:MAG: hypothetical protein AB7W37_15900 [Syntrophobacteraceae bacterium]
MANEASIETTARTLAGAGLEPAVVCADSLLTIRELVEQLAGQLQAQQRIIDAQFQALKAFADLYTELTDETAHRAFLTKQIKRYEREAARLRLPLWFWRPEPRLELKKQLFRRAAFLLHEQGCGLDDCWDLLREYLNDYVRPEADVTDEQLAGVIGYAQEKGADHACAA